MGRQTRNFRNTKSERSASNSYRAYGKYRVGGSAKLEVGAWKKK